MSLQVGQCLQDVHLIKEKIHLIITEEKIVLKIYVKNQKSAMEIINHKEKEMIPLTHEENNFYNEQELC